MLEKKEQSSMENILQKQWISAKHMGGFKSNKMGIKKRGEGVFQTQLITSVYNIYM